MSVDECAKLATGIILKTAHLSMRITHSYSHFDCMLNLCKFMLVKYIFYLKDLGKQYGLTQEVGKMTLKSTLWGTPIQYTRNLSLTKNCNECLNVCMARWLQNDTNTRREVTDRDKPIRTRCETPVRLWGCDDASSAHISVLGTGFCIRECQRNHL